MIESDFSEFFGVRLHSKRPMCDVFWKGLEVLTIYLFCNVGRSWKTPFFGTKQAQSKSVSWRNKRKFLPFPVPGFNYKFSFIPATRCFWVNHENFMVYQDNKTLTGIRASSEDGWWSSGFSLRLKNVSENCRTFSK